jgi:hypothetical protein
MLRHLACVRDLADPAAPPFRLRSARRAVNCARNSPGARSPPQYSRRGPAPASIFPAGPGARLNRVYYVFLLVIAGLAVGVYLLVIFRNVPGAVEERLGALEPLPTDLGVWKADVESDAARTAQSEGLTREVRTFLDRGKLLRQVRYRDAANGEIVRADEDEIVKRRRIKSD